MHPTPMTNLSNNKNYPLTSEHRTRLYQTLNDLDDDQLRFILTNHLQHSPGSNKLQNYMRAQLLQLGLVLIDNYYSDELEQTLYNLTQKRFVPDFYHQYQQQQQQQQRQPPPPSQYYPQQTDQYSPQLNHRFPPTPAISQQLKLIRPTPVPVPSTSINQHRPRQQQSPRRTLSLSHQQQVRLSISSALIPPSSSRSALQRYQVPLLPHPSCVATSSTSSSSSSNPSPIVPRIQTPQHVLTNKIVHKTLPFYHTIACVHERFDIFRYDTYRKQYISHDQFVLSLDACNQLALSYDYDPNLDTHKTSHCLLLRLVRIDQPAPVSGKYEDNLPVNLVVHVNGHIVTTLPTPKPCTRQQKDLIRPGREIDITSYCMFNPILKNEITITWSYRQDNPNLSIQYANAEYALHVFLGKRLTVNHLCEQIMKKTEKFYRADLVNILARAQANDSDLGLVVSDQKLKLTCPIDQKRLKKPIRAVTCQHLQCFDLTNYIAFNERSNKWICPYCNKPALFEDLQIDYYTESILDSIQSDNITEIKIDGNLNWTPITQYNAINESTDSISNMKSSSSSDIILIDDDD